MRLHADPVVANGYDHYVAVAKTEAGVQMHIAWGAPPVKRDTDCNLHTPLPRGATDAALKVVVEVMQAHLRRRWYPAETRQRYNTAARAVEAAVEARDLDEEAVKARHAARADAAAAQAEQAESARRLAGVRRAGRRVIRQARRPTR